MDSDWYGVIASKLGSYRGCGVSGDINGVFASRLAPTAWSRLVTDFVYTKHPVGAELAREGDVSGDINVECAAVFASNLCTYRYLRWG